MVPLQDRNPTTRTAYVTYALVIVNILIFLYQLTLSPQELAAFFREWAVVPIELTASFRGEINARVAMCMTAVQKKIIQW